MQCDEDCRTAGFGKTERPVGWEGDGELSRVKLVRHCERGKPAGTDRLHLQASSHSFTLDFVVLARYQTARLRKDIEGFIEGRMGLAINREKTRVVNLKEEGAKLDFLGFTFRNDRDLSGRGHRYLNLTPSAKSVEREKARIRALTDHHHCFQPLPEMIEAINWQTAGWKGYFNYGYARQAFRKINQFVMERLIRHAHRRSQRPMKPAENESYYGFFKRLGLKNL